MGDNSCPIGHDGCKHLEGCSNVYNGDVTSYGDVNGCWYAHGDYSSYNGCEDFSRQAMLDLLAKFTDDGRRNGDTTIPRLLGESVASQLGLRDVNDEALDWIGFQVFNQYERCFEYGTSPRYAWLADGLTPNNLRSLIAPFFGVMPNG